MVLALGLVLSFTGCGSSQPTVEKPKTKVELDAEAKVIAKASGKLVPIEKVGFLSIDKCIEQGAFQDCYLENYVCGSDDCFKSHDPGVFGDVGIVLFSHKEGVTYKIDISEVDAADIDKGINRNEVTIIGEYYEPTQTIYATEFKAPPPPKKSFFKGCL